MYFYTKIISIGSFMLNGQQGFNPMMLMMMGKDGSMGEMMKMMMMGQMMGGVGGNNIFGNMFQGLNPEAEQTVANSKKTPASKKTTPAKRVRAPKQ